MHKCLVEQWRDGEMIRRMEFTDKMIQQREDGTIVITFPPHELAGGLVVSANDELHLSYTYARQMDGGES